MQILGICKPLCGSLGTYRTQDVSVVQRCRLLDDQSGLFGGLLRWSVQAWCHFRILPRHALKLSLKNAQAYQCCKPVTHKSTCSSTTESSGSDKNSLSSRLLFKRRHWSVRHSLGHCRSFLLPRLSAVLAKHLSAPSRSVSESLH